MNLFRCFAISFALSFAAACSSGPGTDFKVASPDGTLCVGIRAADSLTYTVTRHGTPVLLPSAIGLHFADGTVLGRGAKVTDARRETVERVVEAPFYRQARFTEHYNQLRLTFEGGYAVTFRVFDQGCAYRIETHLPGERTVAGEVAEFNFAGDPGLFAAYSDGLCNAYQSQYEKCRLSALGTEKPVLLPLAADCGAAGRVLVCEADLEAYPGMFLTPSAGGLRGLFAAVPDSCYLHERRCQEKVATRHDYIARVEGTRTYPWRILAVADEDRELPTNDLVYALAAENRIGDCSWVKPGKVAWEWWNASNLYDVDFKAGINNETYKYYIWFASQHGIEYVILDEGWAVNKQADLMQVVPEIDLEELVEYGRERNVGIILWAGYYAFERDMERVVKHYADMGVKGFKVDFMDRDDQRMVDFLHRAAEVCAEHKMLLDFHGVFKPTGLNRTWPNVLNYEGVFGLEQLKWSAESTDMVKYDVTMPFIRMVAGPMDYTQGAMRNASRGNYRPVHSEPMSQGTRCRQLAEYVVFESPITMLCDSPSNYMKEPECFAFMASVPTVWDETVALTGSVGEYIAIARRSGDTWYIGAMTDWTPRELELDLSFIGNGNYDVESFADGINADRAARDFRKTVSELPQDRRLKIRMAPGGGYAARIYAR